MNTIEKAAKVAAETENCNGCRYDTVIECSPDGMVCMANVAAILTHWAENPPEVMVEAAMGEIGVHGEDGRLEASLVLRAAFRAPLDEQGGG